MLAGIYRADSGRVEIAGRLSPFIELGVGFNPEFSARRNIEINGMLIGMTRRQVADRFDSILAFAGLERFVDQQLKNYSSGMLLRLAYSVAIQVPADILLLDEALAVGDADFQQKCFQTFEQMRADGKTVVFVSHDLDAVSRFCDRAPAAAARDDRRDRRGRRRDPVVSARRDGGRVVRLSAVVVAFGKEAILADCLASLETALARVEGETEPVVVVNEASAATRERLRRRRISTLDVEAPSSGMRERPPRASPPPGASGSRS